MIPAPILLKNPFTPLAGCCNCCANEVELAAELGGSSTNGAVAAPLNPLTSLLRPRENAPPIAEIRGPGDPLSLENPKAARAGDVVGVSPVMSWSSEDECCFCGLGVVGVGVGVLLFCELIELGESGVDSEAG